jgi:hypothetical protein
MAQTCWRRVSSLSDTQKGPLHASENTVPGELDSVRENRRDDEVKDFDVVRDEEPLQRASPDHQHINRG